MSSNLTILVDMDGVIADWFGGVVDSYTARRLSASDLDLTRWELSDEPGVQEMVQYIQSQPSFYRWLEPIEGALEALQALREQGHTVTLCSTPDSLNPTCASDKIAWVREHLGEDWVKSITLTHDKTSVRGDILIDDKPVITGEFVPSWRRVIFDQPYNRDAYGARMRGWGPAEVPHALWEAVVRG